MTKPDIAAERLHKAAKGCSIAAEAIRSCPRAPDGTLRLSADRADLIAALLDDTAQVFDEMSLAMESV